MGQGGRLGQRGIERRRWRTDRSAQGAIQRVARGRYAFTIAVILTLHDQLHAARAGTDQVHDLRVDHRRGNSYAYRQRKPHQHKASELDGIA